MELSFLNFKGCEIIGPFLHHATTLRKILGVVIRGADGITRTVGKLAFYPVAVVSKLVQKRGRHGAEAMKAHLAVGISQLFEGEEYPVIPKMLVWIR